VSRGPVARRAGYARPDGRGSSQTSPTPREPHDQSNEQDTGQAGLTDVVFELRQIAAKHVAERANDHSPAHGAERVIEHEGAVRHVGSSREHGRPGTEQRGEAAKEDGLGAVPLKEGMCPGKMGFVEVKEAPIAPHQRDTAPPPDPVAAVIANDGGGDRRRDDRRNREVPQRG